MCEFDLLPRWSTVLPLIANIETSFCKGTHDLEGNRALIISALGGRNIPWADPGEKRRVTQPQKAGSTFRNPRAPGAPTVSTPKCKLSALYP